MSRLTDRQKMVRKIREIDKRLVLARQFSWKTADLVVEAVALAQACSYPGNKVSVATLGSLTEARTKLDSAAPLLGDAEWTIGELAQWLAP